MSPAVCGLVRPVILLPRALAERLSPEQLRAVLLHEAFHLRRKDVWVNCAQALLQIVYWWHPLLWLANARIRRLREEAVDDAVMLALRDEAESYAPTLLEVAKLAFHRPLMSLGLVGIMESRSALRKRIERLVNFQAPRKAGLTFLSLAGIFAFSAIALPMGQAPASAPDSLPADAAAAETTLTVKVDPDTFIRNVETRADWTVPTGTNDYAEILLNILQGEGVNCNPPHHIAFNTKTGELTMQNTPEQLEVFRRVIEQLNRADGKPELPLRDSPFQRKSILIEARFYWMPSADFENLVQDLHAYPGGRRGAPWWSVAPDKFDEFNDLITSLNLKPFVRPRVQTGHGITAEMFIGTPPNGTEFDCRPLVIPGGIDLAFRTQITGDPTGNNQTLAGTNHYQIHGTASAENYGGIVLRAENPGGSTTNLVLILSLHIVTNAPPAHFQERLQAVIGAQHGTGTNNAPPQFAQRLQPIVVRSNDAVTASPGSGQAQSAPVKNAAGNTPGFSERSQVTIPDKMASAGDLVRDGKLLYEMGKLDDAELVLQRANALNPDNAAAHYYLNLVQAAKGVPRTGRLQTQPGRKEIVDKLNRIRLDHVSYDGLPLTEVVRQLSEQTKLRDPEKKGIKFLINPNPDTSGATNPATGFPDAMTPAAAAATPADQVVINLNFTNARLADLLDAIVVGADHPIKYSIVDYGVVFSSEGQLATTLLTRTFKIDPNTFFAGLRRQTQFTGTDAQEGVEAFKRLISDAGVDLQVSHKSVFYNDRLGLLFVRATEKDLDVIESVLAKLNTLRPQIHIKARFMEVPKEGFTFPLADTNGLAGQATGILNAEQTSKAIRMLETKPGFQTLGQPEAVISNGRHLVMRTTQIINAITNVGIQAGWASGNKLVLSDSVLPQISQVEIGPVLDAVAAVLPDGYTIDLRTTASVTFLGYDETTNSTSIIDHAGERISRPAVLPRLRVQRTSSHLRLWDGQTIVMDMGALPPSALTSGNQASTQPEEQDKEVAVFITVTLVDAAGNRVHSDDEMPFAQKGVPPQAY